MRVLISLKSLRDCEYDLKYHHKLQGFVYSILRKTPYESLHDKKGYKFISFSNIFPSENMKKGAKRRLIISSPDRALIKLISEKLEHMQDNEIGIGEMQFTIKNTQLLEPKLDRNCTIITGTPIIIRTAKENFEKFGIKPPKDYDYVFWRKRYPFDVFIKQLEENLFKKYNEFYKTRIGEFPIFEQFMFKRPVCNHIIIKGKEQKIFGSIWEFPFNYLTKEQQKILKFGLDCGFGEMNSMGFGFMNVKR